MQPNQPFNPTPNPNDEPTPAQPAWDNAPQPQPTALPPAQQVAPAQPAADFARYQPQPLQTPPSTPVPSPDNTPAPYVTPEQPTAQNNDPSNVPQPQATQPDQSMAIDQPQPVALPVAKPLSPFELEYQAAVQAPVRKKSHLGLIIASIFAVLLLGGGASAYMWMQDQNDPEKRFYRAIENHLTTTLIQQDYDQKGYNGGEV
ncbi:MAG: hypothetical protein JWM07_747, partial [Candidatus Saccharibacteria bacterium]|nr:hypothetical protein [Candidatus Saccharibacteria bacterium]